MLGVPGHRLGARRVVANTKGYWAWPGTSMTAVISRSTGRSIRPLIRGRVSAGARTNPEGSLNIGLRSRPFHEPLKQSLPGDSDTILAGYFFPGAGAEKWAAALSRARRQDPKTPITSAAAPQPRAAPINGWDSAEERNSPVTPMEA